MRCPLRYPLSLAIALAVSGGVSAKEVQATVHFVVPVQPLADSLRAIGIQANTSIVFESSLVEGRQAPALDARLSLDEALVRILESTSLRFERLNERTITVLEDAGGAGQHAPPAGREGASRNASAPDPGVQGGAPQKIDPAASPEVTEMDAIVITGSRIRRQDVESNNPLSVVGKQQIESLSTANVIDIINRQPQLSLGGDPQVATLSAGYKNTGVSTANLRGLGDNRTLTLVNGRRQVAGTSGTSAVDLNTISKTSLERVEIVTGGSSAIYGADAIAGVINLITRQGFDGLLGEAQVGFTEDGGGAARNLALTMGKSFAESRGNVMVSVTNDKENPIYGMQRDWSYRPGGVLGSLSYVANPLRTGSNASVPRFIPMYGVNGITYRQYGHAVITTDIPGAPPYSLTFDDDGNLIPFDVGTRLVDGSGRMLNTAVNCPDCYNGNLFPTIRNQMERAGVELQSQYTFVDNADGFIRSLDGFLEAKYYSVKSSARYGYSTFAGAGPSSVRFGGYPISIDNPYAPAGLVDLMRANGLTHVDVTRINNDFGNDVDAMRRLVDGNQHIVPSGLLLTMKSDTRMQRYVAGVRGVLANDWNFEVYGNYGRTNADFVHTSDYLDTLFRQQLDAVMDPVSGNIVCRVTLSDPTSGCLPINIMQVGSASEAALAYAHRVPMQRDVITQKNAVMAVDGTLFSWPSPVSGADLPVGFAVGLEYRREASEALVDEYAESGDLVRLGKKVPTVGSYSSWEAFGELNVPILSGVPFAESLEIAGSYRFQDYTTTGKDASYGLSASWSPIEGIKFRGASAHAVRAPNVSELYSGTNTANQGISDPCDISRVSVGPAPQNRRANCNAILGAEASDFVQTPSGKWVILQGNPNLDAEVADTKTLGVVLTPGFVPNLVLTADYYVNEIDGVITSLSANQIVENCVDSPTLDNEFCAAVARDVSGNINTVVAQVFNLARYRTHGWDFGASYRFGQPNGLGRVSLQANATHLMELIYDPVPTNPTLRTRLDGVAPNPTWRANFNTRYELHDFHLDWNVRYLGGVIRSWNDAIGDYSMTEAHPKSGSYIQHDLRFGYRFDDHQVYAGVDNLFDQTPPLTPFTYLSPMYPRIGRNFYVGLKVQF